MARKAVQGFPEKSYYDNTRYLGIVATTDPLNEGLFKHIVNFDVSDTGQSVTPREGFLTTSIKNSNHISLSNNTIIYKDNTLGDYILFDLSANKAYIADISGYNVQNYYLPIKIEITNIDWNELFLQVLIPQVSYLNAFYNGNNLQELITTYRAFIKPISDTKVEHIYDENGISRTLVKVRLSVENETDFDFIIQLRYRATAIGPFAANTLSVEGLPYMFEHPTLAPTDRNLAVSKSIIPEVFQTLYTSANRPSGHTTTLGNFVYIYDSANNYVNNFIYRNTDYTVKPYFTLNPAYYDLNNNINTSDKWAYKFELFNTSVDVTDQTKNVVYSSPWMKYEGVNTKPVPIFNNTRSSLISLGNSNKQDNHYNGSRYIIFVVSKTLVESQSEELNTVEVLNSGISLEGNFINAGISLTQLATLHTTWATIISGISDTTGIDNLDTLRKAINQLGNTAVFYLYDLQASPNTETYATFDQSMQSLNESLINYHEIIRDVDSEFNVLLTATELLEKIAELNIFKTAENITFKILPYASQDVRSVRNTIKNYTSDERFTGGTPYYTNSNPQGTLTVLYNTRVQDITTGKVYRQTISPEGNNYEEISGSIGLSATTFTLTSGSNEIERSAGLSDFNIVSGASITGTGIPANTVILYKKDNTKIVISNSATVSGSQSLTIGATGTITFPFTENYYYKDTRTDRYFQWLNVSTTIGQLKAVANPGEFKETYRWFFTTLKYFEDVPGYIYSSYANYITKENSFINNDYGFYKYNFQTGTYSIETNLNLLKTQWPGMPILFTSSSQFGQQVPYYASFDPNGVIKAVAGTYIQNSITGTFYVKTSATETSWMGLPIPAQPLTLPPSFIQGKVYFDQRNLGTVQNPVYRTFVWENVSNTGYYTEIGNKPFPNLNESEFFDKGLNGIFYMRPYEESELLDGNGNPKNFKDTETLKVSWSASAFRQTFNVGYGFDALTVTYIDQVLNTYPEQIQSSNSLTVFEDSRLLIWNKNILFISEEGRFYWFKERSRIEFAEEIVKVIQYKQIILVFTTQHLYAVYRVETTVTQLNPATNQIEQNVTGFVWLKQIVLYNLLVNKKYADVIQIFNQMVLFYSEDGQLFMIRPSSQIDDQTRFSIQYLNKAANDILENYDQYINERLAAYAKDTRITKDQVQIKALVSINFIKIIYYVPNVITYMLIYDVLNNRYTAYDSLTFTNIFDKRFIESGDLLITEHNSKLYFTIPFTEANIRDNHADMTFTNNFKKEGINCLIDTGNLNLNNHLNKRFRDLHVTFKNLNASNVLFNVETMIDEVIARPFYNEQLKVTEIGGASYLVTVPKFNDNDLIELVDVNQISETATDVLKYSLTNNLFETNNVLMDFSQYTSSKLLTHRTSILGMGKVFRIKLQFISKGVYKLQHFGIIYKERRV